MQIKNTIRLVAMLAAVLLTLASCGEDPRLTVKGTMNDGKDVTLNLVMHYPGEVVSEVLATRGGRFEYTAPAPENDTLVLVEVFSHQYRLLGTGTVRKGEKVSFKLNPSSMSGMSVDGNEVNRSINAFMVDNAEIIEAGDAAAVNAAVAGFVKNNSAAPVSTILMTTFYNAAADPSGAAALFKKIAPGARPAYIALGFDDILGQLDSSDAQTVKPVTLLSAADTMAHIDPTKYRATFIAFSNDDNQRGDSVKQTLRRLNRRAGRRGLVVDHILSNDTSMWKYQLLNDTATWLSVWSGAGVSSPGAARFGITRLPYFVVADSTGLAKYRGTSATKAADVFTNLLNR